MARKKEAIPMEEATDFIPMHDVTNRFSKMIEAFECDFVLARNKQASLIEVQTALQTEDIKLLQDIELLEYLSYGLRHGTIKIYEKEVK
jgi:hypothetical protein